VHGDARKEWTRASQGPPPALEAGIWIDDRERCWCLVVSSPPFFLLIFWREKKKRNFAAVKLFRFILKVFDPVGHNIAAREMRSSRNYMESLFSERKKSKLHICKGMMKKCQG